MEMIFRDGILRERRDDTSRTVTTYDETGAVTSSRPYTAGENAAADAAEAAQAEQAAYQAQRAVDRAILDATAALMAAAHTDGEAWVQPTAAHDAYPLGITVTHAGKTWENITPANVWTPGVSGWREQSAEGGRAAWVQPAGAHDAYPLDAEVTHNGRAWRNTHPSNTYEPGVYGWTDLGPA